MYRKALYGILCGLLVGAIIGCGNTADGKTGKEAETQQIIAGVVAAETSQGSLAETESQEALILVPVVEEINEDNEQNEASAEKAAPEPISAEQDVKPSSEKTDSKPSSFYGIWINASKDEAAIKSEMKKWRNKGYDVQMYVSSEWSGLNADRFYVLTVGTYSSQSAAEKALPSIQETFSGAFIKYSGDYKGKSGGSNTPQKQEIKAVRTMITIYSIDDIEQKSDHFILHANTDSGNTVLYRVDKNAVFAEDCDLDFFTDYEKGDTPYTWYLKQYKAAQKDSTNFALIGVFDVTVEENTIKSFHGIYWWD